MKGLRRVDMNNIEALEGYLPQKIINYLKGLEIDTFWTIQL